MIKCGKCEQPAGTVEMVRRCHLDETWPCDWLVDHGYDEDGSPLVLPCGAHAWETEHGVRCERGHEHDRTLTYLDEDEIAAMRRGAFLPAGDVREMDGHVVVLV